MQFLQISSVYMLHALWQLIRLFPWKKSTQLSKG